MPICVPDGVKFAVPQPPNRAGESRQPPQAKRRCLFCGVSPAVCVSPFAVSPLAVSSNITGMSGMSE